MSKKSLREYGKKRHHEAHASGWAFEVGYLHGHSARAPQPEFVPAGLTGAYERGYAVGQEDRRGERNA